MERKFFIDEIQAAYLTETNSNYAFFQCVDGKIRKIFADLYYRTLSDNQAFHFTGV